MKENQEKHEEAIGEGNNAIQCWICPFCFDDHGYDKTDCKPANLILTIGDLRAKISTARKEAYQEMLKALQEWCEEGGGMGGWGRNGEYLRADELREFAEQFIKQKGDL